MNIDIALVVMFCSGWPTEGCAQSCLCWEENALSEAYGATDLFCAVHSSWLQHMQMTANSQGGVEDTEKRVSLASEVTELEHALCFQQLFHFIL